MQITTLLVITAIVSVLFGIAFVLFPTPFMSQYGPAPSAEMVYVGQLFGAALIMFAVLAWTARKAPDSPARKAIVLAFFLGNLLGFIVALIGQVRGAVNAVGWSTVVIYLVLTVWFAVAQFTKPRAEAPPA